jgi:hypothetical protein
LRNSTDVVLTPRAYARQLETVRDDEKGDLMRTRSLATMPLGLALGLALTLAACSTGGRSADTTSSGNPGGNPGGNSAEGFEGSLTTSGLYAATWTASKDAQADVFNSVSSVTLTSDHQTFGNVNVKPDGSVSFGSAASELSPNIAFNGSGAGVTLDKSGKFVCAFSVDTDLTGNGNGAKLHIKGAMTVHWHPQGIGDLSCP